MVSASAIVSTDYLFSFSYCFQRFAAAFFAISLHRSADNFAAFALSGYHHKFLSALGLSELHSKLTISTRINFVKQNPQPTYNIVHIDMLTSFHPLCETFSKLINK